MLEAIVDWFVYFSAVLAAGFAFAFLADLAFDRISR